MERLPINKMDTWIRNPVPRRNKGGREGKTKAAWEEWNKHHWEEVIIDLAGVEMIGITRRENTPVEKGLTWQSRLSWRISIRIGIWEHHLRMVWNQHLTSKQLEYHNSKQNKWLACRISRNKHMIEISSEVFVVGPTRARVYSTIMYKAVHMTYEVSPNQHSQGFFKTQRDHCKNDRG